MLVKNIIDSYKRRFRVKYFLFKFKKTGLDEVLTKRPTMEMDNLCSY